MPSNTFNTGFFALVFLRVPLFALAAENPWAEPIWKSPPPPENPDAEFDGFDPYALAIKAKIKTDCSIRLIWHRDGKLYCFNSLTSKAFFMDNPARYIRLANHFIKTTPNMEVNDEQKP
ncbi:hypothetical protein [Enterovibrio coralii]|uniref:KTSC domain-containing protein n=1 Tax=Enterovibrio coralii TaxID=294935 RepID=A0A135IA56_9GAMM|nr:hypothetical protein [Enterovibrio coralii]KXF82341.1 hypothetical protein ATN88_09285 [Enterovibrio coralii]